MAGRPTTAEQMQSCVCLQHGQQSELTAGGLILFACLLCTGLTIQTIDKTRKQRVPLFQKINTVKSFKTWRIDVAVLIGQRTNVVYVRLFGSKGSYVSEEAALSTKVTTPHVYY